METQRNINGHRRRTSDFPSHETDPIGLLDGDEGERVDIDEAVLRSQRGELLPLLPIPVFLSASGSYEWSQLLSLPMPGVPAIPNNPISPIPPIPGPLPRALGSAT